jgi:hypothetical protein
MNFAQFYCTFRPISTPIVASIPPVHKAFQPIKIQHKFHLFPKITHKWHLNGTIRLILVSSLISLIFLRKNSWELTQLPVHFQVNNAPQSRAFLSVQYNKVFCTYLNTNEPNWILKGSSFSRKINPNRKLSFEGK